MNTKSFAGHQALKNLKHFRKLNFKSSGISGILYLMECTLCKIYYVSKAKTPLDVRLSNHRNTINSPKAIPTSKQFRKHGYKFIKHAKFKVIRQVKYTWNTSKGKIKLNLKRWEDFWILKLDTHSQSS